MVALTIALAVAGCTDGSSTGRGTGKAGRSGSNSGGEGTGPGRHAGKPSPHRTGKETSRPVLVPGPHVVLPRDPAVLARRLADITTALDASIRSWVKGGPPRSPAPKSLVLQALYQQRIYRLLAKDEELAGKVLRRLDGRLARVAQRLVTAGARLRSLVTTVTSPVTLKLQEPEPPANLLAYYKKGERRFGVDRYVLASINYVESKFGRVSSASPAGAQGPMQFIPSTWAAYGRGGDIDDPHDAVLGAANYLSASGAPGDYRSALFAYNHADAYVDAVLIYAREMRRDPRIFFALYNWQVFTITPHGDVRVTGPGHRYDKRAVVLP